MLRLCISLAEDCDVINVTELNEEFEDFADKYTQRKWYLRGFGYRVYLLS